MLNTAVIMGRLTADPELKTTNSGLSVTSFCVAVDRRYQKDGEERQADFIVSADDFTPLPTDDDDGLPF